MRDALLRRSEATRLTWKDVSFEADGSGRLHIRGPTKTDPEGSQPHAAYLTRATVQALMAIEPAVGDPQASLFGLGPRQIALRIQAAAHAAGLEGPFSRHSGRTGPAHSLAQRGATLVELQQAGRWQSPHMPAVYARNAGAQHNAVARLLETKYDNQGRGAPRIRLFSRAGTSRPATLRSRRKPRPVPPGMPARARAMPCSSSFSRITGCRITSGLMAKAGAYVARPPGTRLNPR